MGMEDFMTISSSAVWEASKGRPWWGPAIYINKAVYNVSTLEKGNDYLFVRISDNAIALFIGLVYSNSQSNFK